MARFASWHAVSRGMGRSDKRGAQDGALPLTSGQNEVFETLQYYIGVRRCAAATDYASGVGWYRRRVLRGSGSCTAGIGF